MTPPPSAGWPAAYRRVWRDTLIRAVCASLDPAALPQAKAEGFYSELTRGRGAYCHLQGKVDDCRPVRLLIMGSGEQWNRECT